MKLNNFFGGQSLLVEEKSGVASIRDARDFFLSFKTQLEIPDQLVNKIVAVKEKLGKVKDADEASKLYAQHQRLWKSIPRFTRDFVYRSINAAEIKTGKAGGAEWIEKFFYDVVSGSGIAREVVHVGSNPKIVERLGVSSVSDIAVLLESGWMGISVKAGQAEKVTLLPIAKVTPDIQSIIRQISNIMGSTTSKIDFSSMDSKQKEATALLRPSIVGPVENMYNNSTPLASVEIGKDKNTLFVNVFAITLNSVAATIAPSQIILIDKDGFQLTLKTTNMRSEARKNSLLSKMIDKYSFSIDLNIFDLPTGDEVMSSIENVLSLSQKELSTVNTFINGISTKLSVKDKIELAGAFERWSKNPQTGTQLVVDALKELE